jgi:SAM-dependent methyltransferase
MRNRSDIRDYYDDFADYQLGYLEHGNPRFDRIRGYLQPLLTRAPQSALDIGCGIGVQTDWLSQHVAHVVGIDLSPRSIQLASALYLRPSFAVCDLTRERLPGGPFDLVTVFDVVEHVPAHERRGMFASIKDVLADDGMLVVNLPSKLFALQNPIATQQVIDEAVGADELVALASEIGLEPLHLIRYGIEKTNQYVFAAFSRTYDVASTPKAAPALRRLRARIEGRGMKIRSQRLRERLRDVR